jgi:hypothetical protein
MLLSYLHLFHLILGFLCLRMLSCSDDDLFFVFHLIQLAARIVVSNLYKSAKKLISETKCCLG